MAKSKIILKSDKKKGNVSRKQVREAVAYAKKTSVKNKTSALNTSVIISPTKAA